LDRRLRGPHCWSGCCEEKNLLSLPRIEPRPFSPSIHRLSYLGSKYRNKNKGKDKEEREITRRKKNMGREEIMRKHREKEGE
jgi:hypothetical protein